MRMQKISPEIKNYLMRVYGQYLDKKLTYNEEVQLFQDLVDSGLYLQMGDEVISFAKRLIEVGLIEPAIQFETFNYEN